MKQKLVGGILLLSILSCKEKLTDESAGMRVKGTITNSPAKMIYLDEVPMTSMQRIVADSSPIDNKGKFELHTPAAESRVYNIRLAQNDYPVAAIINDASSVTLNVKFSKENPQFAESYEVKGSPASEQMKDFMKNFNSKLQEIFYDVKKMDSLNRAGHADSLMMPIAQHVAQIASDLKSGTRASLSKSNNAALSMFMLGYYQSMANEPGYRLEPLEKAEVISIVEDVGKKFPSHGGVQTILGSFKGWMGKTAPDFTLPDPNGRLISLSSFRGKYVLVDFWASWCRPCRNENPNVVKAFNKFKAKNFTILGVSLDRPGQKDAWLKAVMDDHLTWTQVSDLMYWNSPVVNLYKFGEQGIPYNILIDPNGIILAEGLRGEALEAKLGEVLK